MSDNISGEGRGELILYRTEDGRADIHLRAADGTVWLSQAEMAELFGTTPQNVTQHIRGVYEEGELTEVATCKDYLQVRQEGGREVRRTVKTYRLEVILAVGFRIRSPRGSQFRRWAGSTLAEYLVKGFILNDQRLKDAERADYFDELLRRIRDIRSSEKRFYQKLRDLFKTSSSDFDGTAQTAKTFFATIQNKLVYAITGRTAAQLIVERANPEADHMGLTHWVGERVRKSDAVVSKNYLDTQELDQLNRRADRPRPHLARADGGHRRRALRRVRYPPSRHRGAGRRAGGRRGYGTVAGRGQAAGNHQEIGQVVAR